MSRKSKRVSLSYATMPSWDLFEKHFDAEVPNGTYTIRNDSRGNDGDYTARELYRLLDRELDAFEGSTYEEADNEAGDFVSAVLSTLNIEWV